MARRVWMSVAVVTVVLALAGCSAIATAGELTRAGYADANVATSNVNGYATVTVSAVPPAGRTPEGAVEEVQRIVWRTHPGPVDRLAVTAGGPTYTANAYELAAAYGPRDPALTSPRDDPAVEARSILTSVAVVIAGIGVVLGVAAVVIVLVARRRGPTDAGPDLSAVFGARLAQYVVDDAIWAGPVLIAFAALFAAAAQEVSWAAALTPVWLVASLLWGWASYAWWAARHGGRTVGMRALGLRVVDAATGGEVPLGRHTLRWLMFALDGAFLGLVGLLTVALGTLHQRVGDLAARTVVVRDLTDASRRREP